MQKIVLLVWIAGPPLQHFESLFFVLSRNVRQDWLFSGHFLNAQSQDDLEIEHYFPNYRAEELRILWDSWVVWFITKSSRAMRFHSAMHNSPISTPRFQLGLCNTSAFFIHSFPCTYHLLMSLYLPWGIGLPIVIRRAVLYWPMRPDCGIPQPNKGTAACVYSLRFVFSSSFWLISFLKIHNRSFFASYFDHSHSPFKSFYIEVFL